MPGAGEGQRIHDFFPSLYANQSVGSWSLEIEGKIEKQRVI